LSVNSTVSKRLLKLCAKTPTSSWLVTGTRAVKSKKAESFEELYELFGS
jgi:hypothetical protein